MNQTATDLFNYAERYPNQPGHKRAGTSKAAAEKIKPKAGTLRAAVLARLKASGPMTPDECADAMGESLLSIRPRFSELVTKGLIEETGLRRRNATGGMANVYRAKDQ